MLPRQTQITPHALPFSGSAETLMANARSSRLPKPNNRPDIPRVRHTGDESELNGEVRDVETSILPTNFVTILKSHEYDPATTTWGRKKTELHHTDFRDFKSTLMTASVPISTSKSPSKHQGYPARTILNRKMSCYSV